MADNLLLLRWDIEPSVILGLILWSAAYTLAVGPVRRRLQWGTEAILPRQVAFHLGTLAAFIALASPLDTLGDSALFSAHMGQHILLTFAAAPLWLAGLPGWLLQRLIPARARHVAAHPLLAFTTFNGVMWAWHIPRAYDAALSHPELHIIEHLMFIGSALIGWWPAVKNTAEGGLDAPIKLAYLFPGLISCTALAALITLSPIQLYPFYGKASLAWGIAPMTDQQLGGMIMWMPGDMIYLSLIIWAFITWFNRTEAVQQQVKL
jgi:putative membrane protein